MPSPSRPIEQRANAVPSRSSAPQSAPTATLLPAFLLVPTTAIERAPAARARSSRRLPTSIALVVRARARHSVCLRSGEALVEFDAVASRDQPVSTRRDAARDFGHRALHPIRVLEGAVDQNVPRIARQPERRVRIEAEVREEFVVRSDLDLRRERGEHAVRERVVRRTQTQIVPPMRRASKYEVQRAQHERSPYEQARGPG